MAVVKGGLHKITGTINGVTYYTIMGGDTVYLRAKGGPSKSMIKRSPRFEKVRRNNSEWAGCAKMGSAMRCSLGNIIDLADYPIIGAMNAIAKQIQITSTEDEHGKRGLYLSKNKQLLLGFNVSRKQVLESVLRVPIETTINRETGTAQVIIPAINTEMYLYNFRNLPYFRIKVSMISVSDMAYSEERKQYEAINPDYTEYLAGGQSDWFTCNSLIPEQTFNLSINLPSFVKQGFPTPLDLTLILVVGVEFGKVGKDDSPVGVKYAGCGKVMRVG